MAEEEHEGELVPMHDATVIFEARRYEEPGGPAGHPTLMIGATTHHYADFVPRVQALTGRTRAGSAPHPKPPASSSCPGSPC